MEEKMEKKLDVIYQNMRANMAKIDLLGMYSHKIFKNFPENLPEKTLKKYSTDVSTLKKIRESVTELEFNLIGEEELIEQGISREFAKLFLNTCYLSIGKETLNSTDFEQVLYRQELISLFSYLEGYFQDINRILFENDKSLLSNKDIQIPLEKVLNANDYEHLISIIIEDKLSKSGYDKITNIIQRWKKEPYKIVLKLKKTELDKLDRYTMLRNIIVHNNSKVNKEFISYLKNGESEIGDSYILDDKCLNEFKDLIFEVVFSSYAEICAKYPS